MVIRIHWQHQQNHYPKNVEYLNDSTLDADPVATSVVEFMEDQDFWSGTPTDLLVQLSIQVDDGVRRSKIWPKTPSALGKNLQRSAPTLRSKSIVIDKVREGGTGKRITHIQKVGAENSKSASDAETGSADADGSDTGDTSFDTFEATQIITSAEEVEKLAETLAYEKDLGVDLETTGLDFNRDEVEIISISTGKETWLIDCSGVDPSPLFPILSDKHLIFHNAQFDLAFLAALGFAPGEDGTISDTMLMSQIIEK